MTRPIGSRLKSLRRRLHLRGLGRHSKAIARRVWEEIQHDHMLLIAAGVAFYAFLSVVPAISVLVSGYGLWSEPTEVREQLARFDEIMPPQAYALVRAELERIAGESNVTLSGGFILGLLISLWSANRAMKAIIEALQIVYDEKDQRSFLKANVLSLILTAGAALGVVLAMTAVALLPTIFGWLGMEYAARTLLSWTRWPGLAVLLALGLIVLYRVAPHRSPSRWRWVATGAAIGTIICLSAMALFALYTANFDSYGSTYGSISAVVVLMIWLYVSAFAVLLGGQVSSEMERMHEGRPHCYQESTEEMPSWLKRYEQPGRKKRKGAGKIRRHRARG